MFYPDLCYSPTFSTQFIFLFMWSKCLWFRTWQIHFIVVIFYLARGRPYTCIFNQLLRHLHLRTNTDCCIHRHMNHCVGLMFQIIGPIISSVVYQCRCTTIGHYKTLLCFVCLISWLILHILIIMLRCAYQITGLLHAVYHPFA